MSANAPRGKPGISGQSACDPASSHRVSTNKHLARRAGGSRARRLRKEDVK